MSTASIASQPAIETRAGPWARRVPSRHGLFALPILASLLLCAQPIFATDRVWSGTTSTILGLNTNWIGGILPGTTDNADFNTTFTNQPNISATMTIGGIWMATGVGQNVTISGASVLTLNGNTINGTAGLGILVDNSSAYTLTVNAPIKLGAAQTWRNNSSNLLTIGGAVNLNNKAFTIDGTGNMTISGVLSGGGAFTKNGSGNLTLSSNANTYTGTTTVNGGNLLIGTFTITKNGKVTIASGATYTSTGTLNLTAPSSAQTFISGAGTLVLGDAASTTLAPDIYYSPTAGNNYGVTIATNVNVGTGNRFFNGNSNGNPFETYGGDLLFTGSLSGSANLTFTGTASGANQMAYVLSGTNSSLTGGITLAGGANLILNNASALTSANSVTFTPGTGTVGGLYLYGTSVTIGALSGTAAGSMYIRNGSLVTDSNSPVNAAIVRSNAVLTVQQNTNTTFNGIISDGLNDNGAGDAGTYYTLGLTKAGSGILTLGGANTYSGGTTVTAGTLAAGANNVFGSGTLTVNGATAILDLGASHTATVGTVTVAGGGSITGTGTSALTSTGTFEMQSGSVSAILAGSGIVLNKTTTGTATLSGANTYTGGTNINAGTLNAGSSGALGSSGTISFGGGTLQYSASNTTDYSSRFSTAASQAYSIDTNSQNVTFASALTSSGGTLTKLGAGTLTLTAANTFTGSTTVSAGTLALNADSALGSTTLVTINTGGTVLLGSTAGNNSINDAAQVALAGGTLNTGGFSETVGKMTLTANSTLDFGAGTSHLTFNGLSSLGGSTLTVLNWTGTQWNSGGTDQLLFTNSAFTAGTITSQVQFNIGGTLYNSIFLSVGGSTLELVAIPEPGTIFGAGVLVMAIAWRERKRVALLLRRIPGGAGTKQT